jgi:hypothetical protein
MWKTLPASMSEDQNKTSLPSEDFRNMRNDSEAFGKVPNGSETFRTVRNDAEQFRSIPKSSERTENHSLTVREAARIFETAGVARTERSIINWCQPNRQGIPRLDSYFDPNERKYYLTPQSVDRVIQEEIQRTKKTPEIPASESFGRVPNGTEKPQKSSTASEPDNEQIKELERENLDLKIANRAKDYHIEQMEKERTGFFDQLLVASRKVGELETKLLQLEGPKAANLPNKG